MTVTEKVAYLKGLAEGMAIDENSKEGKLLKAITDVLADLALSVEDLEDYTAELTEQVMPSTRIWMRWNAIFTMTTNASAAAMNAATKTGTASFTM